MPADIWGYAWSSEPDRWIGALRDRLVVAVVGVPLPLIEMWELRHLWWTR